MMWVLCFSIATASIILHEGRYPLQLDWQLIGDNKVQFTLTGGFEGWISFGVSPGGTMTGADVVIGDPQMGTAKDFYLPSYVYSDRIEDPSQDISSVSFTVTDKQTTLAFTRAFDTDDTEHDLPIDPFAVTTFIWAFGTSKAVRYHTERGSLGLVLSPEKEL